MASSIRTSTADRRSDRLTTLKTRTLAWIGTGPIDKAELLIADGGHLSVMARVAQAPLRFTSIEMSPDPRSSHVAAVCRVAAVDRRAVQRK